MTTPLSGQEVANRIGEHFPDIVTEWNENTVVIKSEAMFEVARFLNSTPGLDFDFLNAITGVDYVEYFEVVYHLTSIANNHSIIVKTRCSDRDNPTVPSVTSIWQGADFQEREIYDLMGISFSGHPNLKRILLWEGFQGYPLRKDYL